MKVETDKIEEWENTGNIKYNELMKLAKHYHRPPMIFFNANKPEYVEPVPDLRTVGSKKKYKKTPEMSFEFRKAKVRRKKLFMLAEELDDFEIPSFKLNDIESKNPIEIATIISEKLHMNNFNRKKNFDYWVKRIEELGVLVFQFYGIEPKEMRGYALYYDKLPIIGVNSREYQNGKKFTLFHELAHLAIKKEGFNNFDTYFLQNDEKKCNAIAAEILVPSKDLKYKLNQNIFSNNLDKTIDFFSFFFKVSKEVIIRRLLTLGVATENDYLERKKDWNSYIAKKERSTTNRRNETKKETRETIKDDEKEPDPERKYRERATMALKRNGMYYTNSIFEGYKENFLSIDDVAEDLDVSIEVIGPIRKKISSEVMND